MKAALTLGALMAMIALDHAEAAPARMAQPEMTASEVELVRGGGRSGRSRSYSSGYSSAGRSTSYHYHSAPSYNSSASRVGTSKGSTSTSSPTPSQVAGSGSIGPATGVAAGAAVGAVAAGGAALLKDGEARTKQGANVREAASPEGQVVRTLAANTTVRVVDTSGNWRQVATDGTTPIGWVHRSLLE